MAVQTPLQTTQPKKETRPNLTQMIGGSFEVFDTVTGMGGYVNEGPVSGQALENLNQAPELKVNKSGMPSRGSLEFNRRPQTLSVEIAQVSAERDKEQALSEKREEVNSKVGIGNTSYKDTVRDDFTIRTDVQAEIDKKNSESSPEQIQAKRENIIAQATGKASAMNAAMEGGSGTQGGGQANLSFQAAG